MKSARWLPLSLIALCLGAIALFAGMAGGDTNDHETITATFFEQIKAGQYGPAVDGIYASNPWVQSKPDDIAQLKQQFIGLTQLVEPSEELASAKRRLTETHRPGFQLCACQRQDIGSAHAASRCLLPGCHGLAVRPA